MRKAVFICVLLILASCRHEEKIGWFSPAKAKEYFAAVEEVCNKDNGQLWGENLYGPLIYVDGLSRTLYTNFPDNEGLLKEKEGAYSGILPDLFREGQGIVALGRVNAEGVLVADEVLAKHDENYMPPEVMQALEKSGMMQKHNEAKAAKQGYQQESAQ